MTDQSTVAQGTSIKDNHTNGKVGNFLAYKIGDSADLSIVTAYFTIYAYQALKEQLDNVNSLRLLYGEPSFIKQINPEKREARVFEIEEGQLGLRNANRLEQKTIAYRCYQWIKEKVEIKSFRESNLLHGKMYHIQQPGGTEDALLGSSNFTKSGLGYSNNANIELNLEVDSKTQLQELKEWFNDLWHDEGQVKDVKEEVLGYLEKLYANNSPEFIYYKTLYHIFQSYLDKQNLDEITQHEKPLTDSKIWEMLFKFQKDAVRGAINKINDYNGCILADSVGLGKTFEALGVIKHFEAKNEKVLVLCPKKLKENWTIYQAHNNSKFNFLAEDKFTYTVLSHTDLTRNGGKAGDIDLNNLNWGAFDLVVIDESHNFRNEGKAKKNEQGEVIKRSRYQKLMEDIIQSGTKTKLLMLSATPVNTDLSDLMNQIYFITSGKDHVYAEDLGITSLKNSLTNAQKIFTAWARQTNQQKNPYDLLYRLPSAFFKLLDSLTIARSRKQILANYQDEMDQIGHFPRRAKPKPVYPDIDLKGRFVSYDSVNKQIEQYKLAMFKPMAYIKDEYKEYYEQKMAINNLQQFTQEQRENFLIGMMKVNYMKRLESSIHSFAATMDNAIQRIDSLIGKLNRVKRYQTEYPEMDLEELDFEDVDDPELNDALQIGKKLTFNTAHMKIDEWLKDLQEDKDQLSLLHTQAESITADRDAKLHELKKLIQEKVTNPPYTQDGEPNRKALVFTAFSDTAKYIFDSLKKWAQEDLGIHLALVTGKGDDKTTLGRAGFTDILTNFSPRAKGRNRISGMEKQEEIDLLIATDCISEGQNLQDCDYLINYDIHYNPVRVIQRFGRIDRIGSRNAEVKMVNFWPTPNLDNYINLKNRVEARMALVDVSATGDEALLNDELSQEEVEQLAQEDLKFRDQQLKRLKDEVLDLEDFSDTLTLSDFTLDDFRMELLNFIESRKEELENAPLGLYGVVPAPEGEYSDMANYENLGSRMKNTIKPGIIFTFQQKEEGDAQEHKEVNPLHPFFLVYVTYEGDIRYNFTNPKQILDIYRGLCEGRKAPYEKLCDIFDNQASTSSIENTEDDLLKRAVKGIEQAFQKKQSQNLKQNRDAKLIPKQEQATAEDKFDLVTWLVIQ